MIVVCAVPFASYVALQFPKLQTWIAQKAVSVLEDNVDGHLNIDRIAIVFFNKVIAYDMSITDMQGDTLAAIGKLSVSISTKDLIKGKLNARRIVVEDGEFNLISYSKKETNLKKIFRIQPKEKEKKSLNLPKMQATSIRLKDMKFRLHHTYKDFSGKDPRCFNYSDIDLSDINVRINRARYADGVLTCRIRDLSCKDKCGYEVRSLSGFFAMDSTEISLQNLNLIDSYSKVIARYLSFGYDSGKDVNDYVHKIRMGADFDHTILDFRSIGVFARSLVENDLLLDVSGEVTGPVCDLQSDRLIIYHGDSTYLDLGIRITGLPDIDSTVFDAVFNEVTTTGPELSSIVSKFSRSKKQNGIANVVPNQKFTLSGTALGTIHDIASDGMITTGAYSSVGYNVSMLNHRSADGIDIDAALRITDLDAGMLAKTDLLGEATLNAGAKLNIRKPQHGGLSFDIDSLNIARINIHDYDYRDITVMGEMKNNHLSATMLSQDSALDASIQATAIFSDGFKLQNIKTVLDIPFIDLKNINLVKEGDLASASVHTRADITIDKDHSLLGSVLLDDIQYSNDYGKFRLDSLDIHSYLVDSSHIITLASPILSAKYTSTDKIRRLIKRVRHNLLYTSFPKAFVRESEMLLSDPHMFEDDGNYQVSITTHNTSQVCNILIPGLRIANNSTLDIKLDRHRTFDLNLKSDAVVLGNNIFKNILISLDNKDSLLKADFDIKGVRLGKVPLDNTRITAMQTDKGVKVDIGFNNSDTTNLGLRSLVRLDRTDDHSLITYIDFDTSHLRLKGHDWTLNPSAISISPKRYTIDRFRLYSDAESIVIDGEISENRDSSLRLDLKNFDISLINALSGNDLGLEGYLSGEVELYDFFSSMGITLDITGDSLAIHDRKLGKLSALSRWDQNRKRFNVLVNSYLEDKHPLSVSGYFIPERSYINLGLDLDRLQAHYISPFIENAVEINDGTISGNIRIAGTLDKLDISSTDMVLDSVLFTPMFTKVPYYISGPIEMKDNRISLNQMNILDPNGSKATLNGNISHRYLKDFKLNLGLSFNNLMALNTDQYDNDVIYGKAYASGVINLTGAVNELDIDVQVQTTDNSSIHVPMGSSSSASTTDLISYTSFTDTSDVIDLGYDYELYHEKKTKRKSNIHVHGHANINQNTELLIELNKNLGEILRCRGNGSIDLNIAPAKNIMDLHGEYNITGGSYHFVAMTIVSRDFLIDNGGYITFNGDLRNTNLNVGATYQTKASISTLIADTTSVGNRKTINCGINLQGSLTNPEISFDIDIPDLDPITKGMVESALSTPDKVQRQFMSLLISGSFVPDQQSGIVNNSSILYSNASEILSNQFNNIFRQLDIPLDLGLNYQHEETSGKDMFDVAISYQAFNNRLIINGNVGNSQNTSSNWAGDFDAEIKVDKQGKLRISLFTRAADEYSNYLDNTQRSGFGISYQDEFDTFKEFIRNLFYTKKRKEKLQLERIRQIEEELRQIKQQQEESLDADSTGNVSSEL